MVPMVRPQAALHMLHKFLTNQALSPPLPSDATLLAMNVSTFDAWLDTWTDNARSPPYVVAVSDSDE